jgi:small subunit ribosomal protein S4
MARYRGPVVRLERRSGRSLQLKSPFSKAAQRLKDNLIAPGQHGANSAKLSTYGKQLREKQALKWMYGVLEKQFRVYVSKAKRYRGVAGTNLLQILESRLDNFIFRAGFAVTRNQARQLVRHGKFAVNGKRVNIPSLRLRRGDTVSPVESALNLKVIDESLQLFDKVPRKPWIEFNPVARTAALARLPERYEIDDVPVEEQLIIEFYSR